MTDAESLCCGAEIEWGAIRKSWNTRFGEDEEVYGHRCSKCHKGIFNKPIKEEEDGQKGQM